MDNQLLKVEINSSQEQIISGRMLHEFLGIGTQYTKWFDRMCEYGFTEGIDFNSVKNDEVRFEGVREVKRSLLDHILKIDMAKELEYKEPHKAVSAHCHGGMSYPVIDSMGRTQETKMIPRSDCIAIAQKK
ncbi:antA/AntB antirepressor family protein [Anaerosinus massiliensis]|uniref:antA/AntB antirepressor family protein n=1 Tax=Massilibacillus massiliensis TaxID=1806837 RepID=UPI000DA60421|nr:antA/AntB antirepressor family protein [Massilibacillus massiliensis]